MDRNNSLLIIENKIYELRCVKVMFDFDLAEMYGMETKVLKQAVRRNIKRFEGDDFMFEVSLEELSRSQIVTLNKGRGQNVKYKPFAFTELGVAMLSSVLNSEIAIEVNRNIMRTFTSIRNLILNSPKDELSGLKQDIKVLQEQIEDMFADQNDINEDTRIQLDLINEALAELQTKSINNKRNEIGYIATLNRNDKQKSREFTRVPLQPSWCVSIQRRCAQCHKKY